MSTVIGKQLWVNKAKISATKWQHEDSRPLEEGEVLLAIDKFAFTANNVTYAVMGDALEYWKFFPAGDDFGLIPVWGFAQVAESNNEAINVGEKVYGYFPMAESLVVKPGHVSDASFIDAMPHRESLAMVYNQYIRSANDPLYSEPTEALQMLLRPLFTTSFLLQDFFAEQDHFAAEQVVMNSASSKTAIGTAYAFWYEKQKNGSGPKTIALSSAANVDFVRSLGLYDEVYSYDEVHSIANQPSLLIDFAGNAPLKAEIHQHLSEDLKYSCIVGASHWDQAMVATDKLLGPEPQLFFAPTQAEKRMKEWGPKVFSQKLGSVWNGFIKSVDAWMDVKSIDGEAEINASYQDMVAGTVKPVEGLIYNINK